MKVFFQDLFASPRFWVVTISGLACMVAFSILSAMYQNAANRRGLSRYNAAVIKMLEANQKAMEDRQARLDEQVGYLKARSDEEHKFREFIRGLLDRASEARKARDAASKKGAGTP